MTQLIFGLRNYSWFLKIIPAILLKNVLKTQNNVSIYSGGVQNS